MSADAKLLAAKLVNDAVSRGADEAEVMIAGREGFSVCVRAGEVESLVYDEGVSIALTVYDQCRSASVSSSSTNTSDLDTLVDKAVSMVKLTQPDPAAGIPDKAALAWSYPDIDPPLAWNITPSAAIEKMIELEEAALSIDSRISQCESAQLNTHMGYHVIANSHDFCVSQPTGSHSMRCSLIAKAGESMQQDGEYTFALDPSHLDGIEMLAARSAKEVLSRLGSKPIASGEYPVVFRYNVARSFWREFLSAISGRAQYRQASFLLDQCGKQVMAEHLSLLDDPFLERAFGSTGFDNEGVATKPLSIVEQGVLKSYLMSTYSARKLGLCTTGHAGGVHNILVNSSRPMSSLEDTLAAMGVGLFITGLMGRGVNLVTGDYSQGAMGFWVEGGKIVHPVEEITIASNLPDMLRGVEMLANDVDPRSHILTPSILINNMSVAS